MKGKLSAPTTLGEKLKLETRKPVKSFLAIVPASAGVGLISAVVLDNSAYGVKAAIMCAIFLLFLVILDGPPRHFLLKSDKQGFISGLKLSRKTAIFDGSNIYHFGLDRKVGRLPLGALVSALRSEGYRIICFFDANIYFTLRDHGEFPKSGKRFSTRILQDIFELKPNEIYVVPARTQADKFIIETLSHLPTSFAVTNDKYRDYKKAYDFLTKEAHWRKGVNITKGELCLYQHKFKHPLKVK